MLYNGLRGMARPSMTNRGKTRLRSYCVQRLLVFQVLSRSEAFGVSGAIAVSGFTHLRSYWGQRQIVAMDEKDLS